MAGTAGIIAGLRFITGTAAGGLLTPDARPHVLLMPDVPADGLRTPAALPADDRPTPDAPAAVGRADMAVDLAAADLAAKAHGRSNPTSTPRFGNRRSRM